MASIRGCDPDKGVSSSWGEAAFSKGGPRMGPYSPIASIVCRITLTAGLVAGAAACGSVGGGDDDGDGDGDGDGAVLRRASRSSSIALSGDRALVAMVNPDDDSLSIFQTSDDE